MDVVTAAGGGSSLPRVASGGVPRLSLRLHSLPARKDSMPPSTPSRLTKGSFIPSGKRKSQRKTKRS